MRWIRDRAGQSDIWSAQFPENRWCPGAIYAIELLMSTTQIFAELPKLSAAERSRVKQRILELEAAETASPDGRCVSDGTIWSGLMGLAGKAEGLPSDLAEQHDHYLHGSAKREA